MARKAQRVVVLIKHSMPDVDPDVPATEWRLGEDGLRRCENLATKLRRFLPATLVSSPEPKAIQTAEAVGKSLALDFAIHDDLREHERPGIFLSNDEFQSSIRRFFSHPAERVYGFESSDEVTARFENTVQSSLEDAPETSLLLASHGTAITSFVNSHAAIDPYQVWKSLELPSFIALSVPDFNVVGSYGVDSALIHSN